MSGPGIVGFDNPVNGQLSPSISPNFVFDLASSGDASSEKEKEFAINEPWQGDEQQDWTQRPKSMPWTSRPQALRERLKLRWWRDIVIDTFSILMPLPFFFLAATLIFVNGREVNDLGLSVLDQGIKFTATMFPIFFAALTGKAAVKFAAWKLEQGATLGLLEQLMNSRTVATTLTTAMHLRTFNLIGMGLVILWASSPIGSQAVLQIMSTPFDAILTSADVTYINSRQQSYAAVEGPLKASWFPGFELLFTASLIAPYGVKTSSLDLWGNVRIPYYSSIVNSSTMDSQGWIQIPQDYTPVYSSLFGLPLSDMQTGTTTFSAESSYIRLDCTNQTEQNSNHSSLIPLDESIDASTVHKSTLITTNGPFLSSTNVSVIDSWALGYRGPDIAALSASFINETEAFVYPQSCPDCLPFNMSGTDPGTLLYQEFDGNDNTTSIFCTPSEAYIESFITCEKTSTAQNCRVTAQRLSQLPHMSTSITYLSFRQVILGLTSLLPNSTLRPGNSDPVQSYIYNPLSNVGIVSGVSSGNFDGDTQTEVNGSPGLGSSPLASGDVSLQDFGDRMGQLINAFVFASLWNITAYISGSPLNTIVDTVVGGNAASFIPASLEDLSAMIQNRTAAFTVPATLTTQVRVFKISFPWLGVFASACFAMMFSAITGVVFSRSTVLPDYLGYVSSLAKESPFVRMPSGGVTLDGMDRSRLMKNLKVRLGNVDDGGSEVGKLAFARVEETEIASKDRFYI